MDTVHEAAVTGVGPQEERLRLLRTVALFASLPPESLDQLAARLAEERVDAGTPVITEGEPGDRLYLIVEGTAEAATLAGTGPVPLEAYHPGEVFGELALLAPDHRRQATVMATSNLHLLSLDRDSFAALLTAHPALESTLHQIRDELLVIKFLKAASPFTHLDLARIHWLAGRVQSLSVPAGDTIVRQGEPGAACYLLRSGNVTITAATDTGEEQNLGTLGPGSIIGEAALLTDAPRNATVRALEPSELLVLEREDLLAVLDTDRSTSHDLIELIQLRDRPRQVQCIVASQRATADGATITTLKDPRRFVYYRLSSEGYFIWQHLDGHHNLRDLALEYMVAFKRFSPDAILTLVQDLAAHGFVEGARVQHAVAYSAGLKPSKWQRLIGMAERVVEWEVSLPHPDRWLGRLYRSGAWLLFTWPAQAALAVLAVAGFAVFIANLGTAEHATSTGGWVLLFFFAMYFLAILLHELGHAFTVKTFGREVPRFGVGWYWFGPIAYSDTSDMWLADRWPRILVTLGGLYASMLVGGTAAIVAVLLGASALSAALWQLALLSFLMVLLNLNPLLEYDGYFILMDYLDRPNLRQHCLDWLGHELTGALRQPAELKRHKLELAYGVGSIAYIVFSSITLLVIYRMVVQGWLSAAMPHGAAMVVAWVVTLSLAGFGVLSLVGSLRSSQLQLRRRPSG